MVKIVVFFLYAYIRLVFHTTRWKRIGYDYVQRNGQEGKPQIIAFWHGRMVMMPLFRPKTQETLVISSRHRDGRFMAMILEYFGVDIIRGSSRRKGSNKDRGGRQALIGAVQKLRAGCAVAFTPDGPLGPRMRVGGNMVSIAKMAGAEIIPMTYSTSNAYVFKSWDRFFVPLPFSRGYYMAAEPVFVPKDATAETVEKIRQKIEDTLNELTKKADRAAHRKESPEPAALVSDL